MPPPLGSTLEPETTAGVNCPSAHCVQADASLVAEYAPGKHAEHTAEASELAVPALQTLQLDAPSDDILPAGHAEHVADVVAPITMETSPRAQRTQVVPKTAPTAVENEPASQLRHSNWPLFGWNWPATHITHVLGGSLLGKEPAAHFVEGVG